MPVMVREEVSSCSGWVVVLAEAAKAVVAPTTTTKANAQAMVDVFLNFIIASILSEIAVFPKWLHKADIPFLRSSILININA